MNALIRYPGSKWRLAKEIVSLMPDHHSYLEPFFGSGAVLFTKSQSPIETVNDIDGEVVNFFEILRTRPADLAGRVFCTPYSREVYDAAYCTFPSDPLDRAFFFTVRSCMSHGFKSCTKSGFKMDVQGRESSYCVKDWNALPARLLNAAMRLKQVQIENRPALEVIRRFNHEKVLIYADPPYLPSVRCCKQYRFEMTEADHIVLLDALLAHRGPAIISGYPSDLYDSALKDWTRLTFRSFNNAHDPREEVIWCNFSIPPFNR